MQDSAGDSIKGPELAFLGTGAAWRTPELGCPCTVCAKMKQLGESRTRTSLLFRGAVKILIDCGPDVASQLEAAGGDQPDCILITHEHGDHYLGLDELEVFRRRVPAGAFKPLPTFATAETWEAIQVRFGYLLGRLLEKITVQAGQPLPGFETYGLEIIPFKTDHGPTPKGSVGYIINYFSGQPAKKLVYTSDFKDVPGCPPQLERPDILVAQSHWFNEPTVNRPSHMSLQRLLDYIRRWDPREHVYLVHISDGDPAPGEKADDFLKKSPPKAPMLNPSTGRPFSLPLCQAEWQSAAEEVFLVNGLNVPVTVARDGLIINL